MKTAAEVLAISRAVDGQGTEDHANCTCTGLELALLIERVMALPVGSRIVEIGVFTGRSASVYLQLQEQLQLDIHLIDNWSWNERYAAPYFAQMVLDKYNEVPFTLHKRRSDRPWPWGLPIHLLYVDGWHDMPGIDADCRIWLPRVVPGGLVAFHDSQSPDVASCIEKYVKAAGYAQLGECERITIWRKPL